MYSGLTFTRFSGRIMGAHQKLDRVARRHLKLLLPENKAFPSARQILQFEGLNGPDGIKRKSPAKDEPWHYLNPLDDTDNQIFDLIGHHYDELVAAIKKGNREQASFQAAWLAHAIVDGLTPAHHYPYEEMLIKLRNGEGIETRTTPKEKLIMKGDTYREVIANNWRAWGPKGLFLGHIMFELGFAAIVMPLRFPDAKPHKADLAEMEKYGPVKYFHRRAKEIYMMDLFDTYLEKGWTGTLARKLRQQLAPIMVKTITLTWYQACLDSAPRRGVMRKRKLA
jgi:hypothetical protein